MHIPPWLWFRASRTPGRWLATARRDIDGGCCNQFGIRRTPSNLVSGRRPQDVAMVGSSSRTGDVRWPPVNRRGARTRRGLGYSRGPPGHELGRSASSASGHHVGLSLKQHRAAIGPVGAAGPHRKNSTWRWSPPSHSASWMARFARRRTRPEATASTCSLVTFGYPGVRHRRDLFTA